MLRWFAVFTTMAGCASPVTKAERALERFGAGHPVAWHEARFAAETAVLDPGTSQDPEAWAVRGQVYLRQVDSPDLAALETDPVELALRSYEAATHLGADATLKARLRTEVPELEALVQQRLSRHIEVRNWQTAARELEIAQRVHRVNLAIGTGDVQREIALRRLACRVEAEAGDVQRAADHYEALVGITRTHELPLALDVILALADRGRPQRALALADKVAVEFPGELELLEVRVGLAIDLGDARRARSTLDERRGWLSESVEGALAAARLYLRLDAGERARTMWTRVLALRPDHFGAHLALGRSLAGHAAVLQDAWSRAPEPPSLRADLAEVWSRAEHHLRAAQRLDPARQAPLEALVELYRRKWSDADPAALSAPDRDAYDFDQVRRSAVQAMLDAR